MSNLKVYIKHPEEIPIELDQLDATPSSSPPPTSLQLICHSNTRFNTGDGIAIRIPLIQPGIEVTGFIDWCNLGDQNGYEIGIRFNNEDAIMRMRMLEQLCYIHRYRKYVLLEEGRDISAQEAALEWINKYAALFPVDAV